MRDDHTFHSIGSAVSGITTHSATGTFITGTFSYTPDEMRAIVGEFLELAQSYRESRRNADTMASVEAPGLEYASESHASAARSVGQAYLHSLEDSRQYCLAQAQKFQDTLDDYLGLEHRNVAEINSAESPGDQAEPQAGV